MMLLRWIRGVLAGRPGRISGASIGVTVTIALLGTLGVFLGHSVAGMTRRAAKDVPLDWQAQVSPTANIASVEKAIAATKAVTATSRVEYLSVSGFSAKLGGTTQVTGSGQVVRVPTAYRSKFPDVFRQLTGKPDGVELAQQTAANLHAGAGDTIAIKLPGGAVADVKVDGVITLSNPDAFFQQIGGAVGAAPQAPPDNVAYVPGMLWQSLLQAAGAKKTASASTGQPVPIVREFHISLDKSLLPPDPTAAYTYVTSLAHNLEARTSGGLVVANNLAATLGSVRADALYAKVLFLFLGFPGAILAILTTLALVLSGSAHLSKEQFLLRTRGAGPGQVFRYAALEPMVIGVVGVVGGLLLTALAARLFVGRVNLFAPANLGWEFGSAIAVGLVVIGTLISLVVRRMREGTRASARTIERPTAPPLWRRLFLDVVLIAIGIVVYWQSAQKGYQVVLAPEGTPTVSVHYEAFIAPFCIWLGGALLGLRLFELMVSKRRLTTSLIRPVAGRLSPIIGPSLGRQNRLLARGVVMVGLAVAFAVSTSIFNSTYNAQARVDAQLTNGSDVTVTGKSSVPVGSLIKKIQNVPGVAAAQPMMHRFVYVGSDLQDLYGIHPLAIGNATAMSNAYFASGNAAGTLNELANKPSAALVSLETKNDYQLNIGDTINLRLQFASDHQYHAVPFTFVGVVRKFPSAPKDSFIVANAEYVAAKTGNAAQEIVLTRTSAPPQQVAGSIRGLVAGLPGVQVSDITSAEQSVNSNLTAVDLHGLTSLELVFAILAVFGTAGLVLALGLAERRRSFAILEAVGAEKHQLGKFVWSEVLLVLVSGLVVGTVLGFATSGILVTILRGVFDPPPQHLFVPMGYLGILLGAAVVSAVGGAISMTSLSRKSIIEEIRRL